MMNSKQWMHSLKMQHQTIHLALIASLILVCSGATTISVDPVKAANGTKAVMFCQYSLDAAATFDELLWRKGDTDDNTENIATLNNVGSVTYYGSYSEPDYKLSSTDKDVGSNLTILSVSKDVDSGTYRCDLVVNEPFSQTYKASNVLTVNVPASSIVVTGDNGKPLLNNSQVTLVTVTVFTVEVPGIYPSVASFKWTVDGTQLPAGNVVRLPDVVDGSGLITSGSNATLTPLQEYNGKRFGCRVLDMSGGEMIAFYLDLNVPAPQQPTTDEPTGTTDSVNGSSTQNGTMPNNSPPDSSTSTDVTTNTLEGTGESNTEELSVGVIVGIACGCVVVVALVGGGIAYMIKAHKKGSAVKPAKVDSPREPESAQQNGTNDKNTSDKKNDNGETAS